MEKLIRSLVRKHKTNCPFTIARNLNISVWFDDLGSGTRGFYYRKLRRRYIVIHEQLDDHWKRFVCAHELAHDRLHKGMSRFFLDQHTLFVPGRYEREANEFAVALMLYGSNVEEGENVESYCARHGVPHEMVRYV